MDKMKAEVTAFRPIFRLLCCRRGLRKNFRGLRPRNLTPKKLSRAVKNLPDTPAPHTGTEPGNMKIHTAGVTMETL